MSLWMCSGLKFYSVEHRWWFDNMPRSYANCHFGSNFGQTLLSWTRLLLHRRLSRISRHSARFHMLRLWLRWFWCLLQMYTITSFDGISIFDFIGTFVEMSMTTALLHSLSPILNGFIHPMSPSSQGGKSLACLTYALSWFFWWSRSFNLQILGSELAWGGSVKGD